MSCAAGFVAASPDVDLDDIVADGDQVLAGGADRSAGSRQGPGLSFTGPASGRQRGAWKPAAATAVEALAGLFAGGG